MPQKKKTSFVQLEKKFWEMPLSRQKNFLKNLYNLSPENKDTFEVWITGEESEVLERLIQEIEKETKNRIGRFRKMRVAKLNEIVRKAKKYPLSDFSMITLFEKLWENTAEFVVCTGYVPNRYREVVIKYLSEYRSYLLSIAETQERINKESVLKGKIQNFLDSGAYFPHLQDFYLENFL